MRRRRSNQATLGCSLNKLTRSHAGPRPIGSKKPQGRVSPAQRLLQKAREEHKTYGGKLKEHAIQTISRDLLVEEHNA